MNSKRFIDNNILPKGFRKLECSLKLTWYYLWSNCDPSGVYEIDEDLFEFENGFELDVEAILKAFNDLIEIYGDKILLKDFIRINIGNEVKENYNPHKPTLRAIQKNNLKLNSSLNQACFKLVDEEGDEDEEEDGYEEEKGKKDFKGKKPDYNEIIELFNSICTELPKVQKLTPQRRTLISARIKEYNPDNIPIFFESVFSIVATTKFLNGDSERGWKADFDWIIKQSNFIKIIEKSYSNGKPESNSKAQGNYSSEYLRKKAESLTGI